MSSISDVARAFVEGRSARCHNAVTDGSRYLLHGHCIAEKLDGKVRFDWCGWRTPTTQNHMTKIMRAGRISGDTSRCKNRDPDEVFEVPAAWAKAAKPNESGHLPPTNRYHRYDAWRGHEVPALAIAGASDTGTWDDSPCPSDSVKAEIERFQKELLDATGIKSRCTFGQTSNVFCGKRWVTVSMADFERAAQFATNWLKEHNGDTQYIHDADLDKLGYVAEEGETA